MSAQGDWVLALEVPSSMWMSANREYGRGGYKKRLVTDLQRLTMLAARAAQVLPMPDPCDVLWTIRYPKGVTWKADPENSAPTCKPILDALVAAGYIEDDAPRHIHQRAWERGPNLNVRGLYRVTLTATRRKEI